MKLQIFSSLFVIMGIISSSSGLVEWGLVRPSFVNDKSALPCQEDYFPCSCGDFPSVGLYVICEMVSPETIASVLNRTSSSEIFWLQLRPSPNPTSKAVTLPPDLLGGKRAKAIDFYCPTVVNGPLYQLTIDRSAIVSSAGFIKYFYILGCDLGQQRDFSFLTGFEKLTDLYIYGSTNIEGFETLPSLPSLSTLSISHSTGLERIENFPAQAFPYLQQIYLTDNHLDDKTADDILFSIATTTSVKTLDVLSLAYNYITQIPPAIRFFRELSDVTFSGNNLLVISFDSFALSWTKQNRLILTNTSLAYIKPGMIEGNIVHADLTRNNLTTFESVTFRPILEGMVSLNGSLSIDSNPFDCDCSLAWLIRDNRKLLSVVAGGECKNSTRFDQLDPLGFKGCS